MDRLAARRQLTTDLAGLCVELGQVRAESIRQRRSAWEGTAGVPVTERREIVRAATADFDGDAADLEGQIAAVTAEIAQLDAELTHGA